MIAELDNVTQVDLSLLENKGLQDVHSKNVIPLQSKQVGLHKTHL